MEWIEANPLPQVCVQCQEEDCYNCDFVGLRWTMSKRSELLMRKKSLQARIDRLFKELSQVEKELKQWE